MILGLTGGIATGKSTVSDLFRKRGAVIIDADIIAREVVDPGTSTLKKLASHFGSEVLMPDGSLNRNAMGKIVFSNPVARKDLEEIIHPPILAEIRRQINEAKEKATSLIVLDAPLLIETNLHTEVDKVLLVYTDEDTQRERLILRDGLTEEEALARINSQMPIDEKRKYADIIIDNRGDLLDLKERLNEVLKQLRLDDR